MDTFTKKQAAATTNKLVEQLERVPTGLMKIVRLHQDIARQYRQEKAIAIGTSFGRVGDGSAASQVAETAEKVTALGLAYEGLMEEVVETPNDVSSLA
jgi:hypothetical protein